MTKMNWEKATQAQKIRQASVNTLDNPGAPWRRHLATPSQRAFLRARHLRVRKDLTSGEASDMIGTILSSGRQSS